MTTYADFEAFAAEIGERRRRAEQLTPSLVSALETGSTSEPTAVETPGDGRAASHAFAASIHATSGLLVDTVDVLGRAEEELRVQNEALFAAHTELAHEHQLFRDLFEHAPVAYVVTTRAGVLTRVNAAATRLLTRPANALIGKPLSAYVALGDRIAFRAALARSACSQYPETWCISLQQGDVQVECRVHTRVVSSASVGGSTPCDGPNGGPLLHWVITEAVWDTPDDLV